jgi:hypothetical protein
MARHLGALLGVVPLVAPTAAGSFRWTARFDARGSGVPHRTNEHAFSFTVLPPPEHRLTVEVVEAADGAPVAGFGVRVGPWRGVTDAAGLATMALPRGEHGVAAWKSGYRAASRRLTLESDTVVRLAVEKMPEDADEDVWI